MYVIQETFNYKKKDGSMGEMTNYFKDFSGYPLPLLHMDNKEGAKKYKTRVDALIDMRKYFRFKRPNNLVKIVKLSILIPFLALLLACSKGGDYGYLNSDRRPQVIIISERYTNPPDIDGKKWKPYKIVFDSLSRDIDFRSYEGLKPDTLVSSCSIDKVDSLFKIEIRKYLINR